MIKIALIDDHAISRNGIKKLIDLSLEMTVVLEAANGSEFFNLLSQNNLPEVVILDINMPVMDGFETISLLKQNFPEIKIIVFSIVNGPDAVAHMLNGGASGCLCKSADPEDLVNAIMQVYNNGRYVRRDSKSIINGSKSASRQKAGFNGNQHLTIREVELVKLCAAGLSYAEIGQKMNIGSKTVENYRDRLFIKLDITNRNALTLYAIQNGLFNPY